MFTDTVKTPNIFTAWSDRCSWARNLVCSMGRGTCPFDVEVQVSTCIQMARDFISPTGTGTKLSVYPHEIMAACGQVRQLTTPASKDSTKCKHLQCRIAPGSHWTEGWEGPTAGMKGDTKRKQYLLFPCLESNPSHPAGSLVTILTGYKAISQPFLQE